MTTKPPTVSTARADRAWRQRHLDYLARAPRHQQRAVLAGGSRSTEAYLASAWIGERHIAIGLPQPERDRQIGLYGALLLRYPHGDPWALVERAAGCEVADA